MEMKNKLYKHHKTRMHFFLHDLLIVTGSACAFFGIIALPTYISVNNSIESKVQASEQNETTNNDDSEELLSIEESIEE